MKEALPESGAVATIVNFLTCSCLRSHVSVAGNNPLDISSSYRKLELFA